jgi:hypothetical protein
MERVVELRMLPLEIVEQQEVGQAARQFFDVRDRRAG